MRLRTYQPDHRALPIVTVVDLHGEHLSADMTGVVCIAPNWDGKVAAAYGVRDLDQEVVAVLVGPDGAIVGQGRGAEAAGKLLGS